VAEELVSASMMNTHVRDNLNALRDYFLGAQDLGADWLISTGRKLSWSDPDVAHGITTLAATDVWAAIQPTSGTVGGATVFGFTDADQEALRMYGIIGSSGALASTAVVAFGAKKNGTGIQALAAGESVFDVSNNGTVYARFLGDGTISLGLNSNPKLLMDTNDYQLYSKASNFFQWVIGSVQEMLLDATGLTVTNLVTAESAVFTVGICAGFSGTPTADEVQVGDANFAMAFNSSDPLIRFDTGSDHWIYNRVSSLWTWVISASDKLILSSTRLELTSSIGLCIGTSNYTANAIRMIEISEPTNPSANEGVFFLKDNGAGKTQACVRFASGATQVYATEP